MKRFCLLTLAACLPLAARARIGETPAEISQRYGPPVALESSGGRRLLARDTPGFLFELPTTNYIFKTYVITVSFSAGKCVRESVRTSAAAGFSRAEALALRDAVGAGLKWLKPEAEEYVHDWQTASGDTAELIGDELVVAAADYHRHFQAYAARTRARQAAAEKQKAAGF